MGTNMDRVKFLGMAVLFVAFLLGAINSIATTTLSVLDNDPATYVIVVMLMLFVFICFSMKERLRPVLRASNIAYASLVFVAYLLLVSYLRVALSFVFSSYRIDALLFPLLLAAMIIAIFGYDGIKKLKQVVIYSVFASPVLLLPVISLNNAFANANAAFVYGVLKSIGTQVVRYGLVITAPSTASITISTTCVSLGTFIALVMFLIPVAYLYNGKISRKILWLVSGFALMLAMNVVRMLTISLVWAYYGLGSAITTFHAFAGQLIFYAAIIVMLVIAFKYGMSLRAVRRASQARPRRSRQGALVVPYAAALVFGIVAFLFSLQYWTAIYASAPLFSTNATYSQIEPYVAATLGAAGTNVTYLGATNAGQLFALGSISNASNATYAIVTGATTPVAGRATASFNSASGLHSYLLRNGVTISGAAASSNNFTFDIAYFALPYNTSSGYISANFELFKRVTSTETGCSIGNAAYLGTFNYVQSGIYNIIRGVYASQDGMMLCYAYRMASSVQ